MSHNIVLMIARNIISVTALSMLVECKRIRKSLEAGDSRGHIKSNAEKYED